MFPYFMRRRPHLMPLFIIGGIVFAAAMAFVLGVVVMALWNWLMPEIFGLTTTTYWQAWGIVLLAHILFKTGNHSRHWREDRHNGAWKEKFRSRFKDWSGKEADTGSSEPSGDVQG